MTEPAEMLGTLRYILRKVEDAAASAGFVLPGRRYVTTGGSVFDCEQVTVSAMSSEAGTVSSDPAAISLIGNCEPTWNAVFEVAIVVCASEIMEGPRGEEMPTVAAIESDAAKTSAMYGVLRDALDSMVASDEVGAPSASVTFGQPEGGFIAVVMSLNINLWVPLV